MINTETIIEQTAQELIDSYFYLGNAGFSKACIKAKLREMVVQILRDSEKPHAETIKKGAS